MLARNLLGICPEFARNSEFARNLLGIRSENGPDQPCAELCNAKNIWAGSSDIFYFCPSSKGRGGGAFQRGGGISLKSEEKGGKKGRGRRGRCRKRVGGIF